MRLNVEYIPLSKIKPDLSIKVTEHVKKLRRIMWDCMHILVVRKNNNGQYTIISGEDRLEYLQKHTKNKFAPCIIDENKVKTEIKYWVSRLFHLQTINHNKYPSSMERITPQSLSIIRKFLKQEPSFNQLNHFQKIKVLLVAVQYKKTAVHAMRLLVKNLQKKEN
ncbi:hypothetical protein [Fictibacillus barbaricus]|uniref:ParB/Sulfiredoxin domain-containing protein n=1 Tax=Fictibacillus barbaricus TaxID=182136 RepID=A0ABU1TVT6_9BACL|nr:hypothetical protein [Fictibacillus barbaricus]MDR7071321.1 hypothetical protein [Fictibacillus barbaricus]